MSAAVQRFRERERACPACCASYPHHVLTSEGSGAGKGSKAQINTYIMKTPNPPLKSIAEETADCIAAWHPYRDKWEGQYAHFYRHTVPLEILIEPPQSRIDYILLHKPTGEQAARLRNFRPMRLKVPAALDKVPSVLVQAHKDYVQARRVRFDGDSGLIQAERAFFSARRDYNQALSVAYDETAALHDKDWPCHTWDGKTMF